MSVTVTRLPFKDAGPDKTAKVTGNPELATATSGNDASPNVGRLSGPNVRDCGALATANVRSILAAAVKFELPACSARTVTAPEPTSVTMLLSITAGPPTMLNRIGNPEFTVASSANGASSANLFSIAPNAMSWLAFATVKVSSTAGAALKKSLPGSLSLTRFRGQGGAAAGSRKTKPMETKSSQAQRSLHRNRTRTKQ